MKFNWKPKLHEFKTKEKEERARTVHVLTGMIQCSISLALIITAALILILKPTLPVIPEITNTLIWFFIFILASLVVTRMLPVDTRFRKSICSKCSLFATRYCPFNTVECAHATNKPLILYKGKKYEE